MKSMHVFTVVLSIVLSMSPRHAPAQTPTAAALVDAPSPFEGSWRNASTGAVIARIEIAKRGDTLFGHIWGNCSGCDWGEQPLAPAVVLAGGGRPHFSGSWTRAIGTDGPDMVHVDLTLAGGDLSATFRDDARRVIDQAIPAVTERFVRTYAGTPPRPVYQAAPRYTAAAMRARIEGVVRVQGIVEVDGMLSEARVIQSLDKEFGLDEAALDAASQWRFQPGHTKDGQPVRVTVTIEIEFKIQSGPRLQAPPLRP